MGTRHTYTDDELTAAVAASHSWRGVLRALGLKATSAGSSRCVQAEAKRCGLDSSHFTGQRRWTDRQLVDAIANGRTWNDVIGSLGLSAASGSVLVHLRAHAARLGLDVANLSRPVSQIVAPSPFTEAADLAYLGRAGPTLAAAWFLLRGWQVCWPLEPCRYDLLVRATDRIARVQVKTTRACAGSSGLIQISNSRRRGVAVYAPDEIDYFFLIDGDLRYYLIPFEVVAGFQAIALAKYANYLVEKDMPSTSA